MAEEHGDVDVLGSTGGAKDVDTAGPSTYSPISPFAAMCEIATAAAVVAVVDRNLRDRGSLWAHRDAAGRASGGE